MEIEPLIPPGDVTPPAAELGNFLRAWHALGPAVDAVSAPVLLQPDDPATF